MLCTWRHVSECTIRKASINLAWHLVHVIEQWAVWHEANHCHGSFFRCWSSHHTWHLITLVILKSTSSNSNLRLCPTGGDDVTRRGRLLSKVYRGLLLWVRLCTSLFTAHVWLISGIDLWLDGRLTRTEIDAVHECLSHRRHGTSYSPYHRQILFTIKFMY